MFSPFYKFVQTGMTFCCFADLIILIKSGAEQKEYRSIFIEKNAAHLSAPKNAMQLEKTNMLETHSVENPYLKKAELFALCVSKSCDS